MCGITGSYRADGATVTPPPVERLAHRGPDGTARYTSPDGRCALALARLAIVRPDLPPRAPRDGSIVTVAAGEIYDHESDGIDTDEAPARFRARGAELVRELRGPLTVAAYDEERRELTLVRDAVGKRPLFFRRDDKGVAFATEAKALADANVSLDPAFVADVLAYGVSRRAALAGVTELLPGEALIACEDGVAVRRVDELEAGEGARTADTAALLGDAIALRRPRDVSAAVALGGMDSQLVASHLELPSLTLDADADETARAAAFARHGHEVVPMPAPDFAQLRRALFHLETVDDRACWEMAPAALALASAAREAGHRVLYLGEGADELFVGYPWAPAPAVPEVILGGGDALVVDAGWRARLQAARGRARWDLTASPVAITRSRRIEELAGRAPDDHALSSRGSRVDDPVRRSQLEGLRDDMHLLPVLHADRLYFAHGVETRAPFLDRRLIDHALALPTSALHAGTPKPLVRAMYRERLGREPEKKRGFTGAASPPRQALLARAGQHRDRGARTVDPRAFGVLVDNAAGDGRLLPLLWRAVLLEELLDVVREELS